MSEEKVNQEKTEEQPAKDTGDGDKPKTTPLIEGAVAAAERLEAANKKQEELLAKQEQIMARQALGGRTEAGALEEKKKEETPQEYADRVTRGEANPLKEDGIM